MERYEVIPAVYLLFEDAKGRMLFSRRANTGYMDGYLGLVAGHIERSESVFEAAAREATEEIDASIREGDMEIVHVAYRKLAGRVDYFVKVSNHMGTIRNMEPEKCSGLVWEDRCPDDTIPYIKGIMSEIEQGRSFSHSDL